VNSERAFECDLKGWIVPQTYLGVYFNEAVYLQYLSMI